jgi:hypothetical protein
MTETQKVPADAFQQAMKAAIPQYSGEKSMQDPDKNPLDSGIDPKDSATGPQGA